MGYKTWPPRFLLRGGPKSPNGSFGIKPSGGGDAQLGAELSTNGTFAADVSWTKDAGWAIAAGVASATATGAGAYLHQAVTVAVNKTYWITYTVTAYTGGDVAWSFDSGQTGAAQSATGTFTEVIALTGASTELRFGRVTGDFTGSIDNVTLRQA